MVVTSSHFWLLFFNESQNLPGLNKIDFIKKLAGMSITDKWINIIVVAIIVIYIAILVAGFVTHKLLPFTSILNLITGILIVGYWLQKQIHITQHAIDLPEMIVLCFEVAVIATAALVIKNDQTHSGFKIIQYIIFGIHVLASLLFLLFMLFFKINRMI